MKRWILAITSMIAAVVLVQGGSAQRPNPGGQPGQTKQGGPQNPLIQAFDTDRDGVLSAAEIDAAPAKLRERDANKDGKLTAAELPARQPGGGPRGSAPMESTSGLEKPPLPKDDGEKRILAALDQARQGQ